MATVFLSTLTGASREALARMGVESDESLAGIHVPDLLEVGVSWGQVHKIVAHLDE